LAVHCTDHSRSESGHTVRKDRTVEEAVHIVRIDHRVVVADFEGAVAVRQEAVFDPMVEGMVLVPLEGGEVVAVQAVFVVEGEIVVAAVAVVDVVAVAVSVANQTIEVALVVVVVAADVAVVAVVDRDIAAGWVAGQLGQLKAVFQETTRLACPVGPAQQQSVVVANPLQEAGCLRALPTQIVAAALVLEFPIHQATVAAVAVAAL